MVGFQIAHFNWCKESKVIADHMGICIQEHPQIYRLPLNFPRKARHLFALEK